MNIWPFKKQQSETKAPVEPSTMDRLLTRDCTRDEFFLLYSKLLQERMPDHKVEFSNESTLRLVGQDGKESTTYLDNLWLKYKAGMEDRSELIEKYIRLAQDLGKNRADTTVERQNVVAMVKDSRYLEFLKPREEFAIEHLCGDLWVIYAEDQPERTLTLKSEDLRSIGVTDAERRTLAVENLSRILPPAEVHGEGPGYLLTAGNDYVASLLLLDGVWDQVASIVSGQVVATVPTRDVLLFTGSESVEGLKAIREESSEISNSGPHAISDTLIVRRNGTWTVFNAN
jgi:uncharacterized protein YtpQ (UPF0354 family)